MAVFCPHVLCLSTCGNKRGEYQQSLELRKGYLAVRNVEQTLRLLHYAPRRILEGVSQAVECGIHILRDQARVRGFGAQQNACCAGQRSPAEGARSQYPMLDSCYVRVRHQSVFY